MTTSYFNAKRLPHQIWGLKGAKHRLLTLVLVAVLASSSFAQEERAKELVAEGHKLMLKTTSSAPGVFEPALFVAGQAHTHRTEAINRFSQALEAWPSCSEALVGRSMAHYFQGDLEASQSDALRALELGVSDHDYFTLTFAFEGEEARAILRRGLKQMGDKSPLYPLLRSQLAQTYWYEGDFESQAKELEALLEITPVDPMVYEELGRTYQAIGDFSKAERAYEEALPESALSLIHIKMAQGHYGEALKLLEKHEAQLETDEFIIQQAVLQVLLKQPAEIEKALEAVEREGKNNVFGVDDFAAGVLEHGRGNIRIANSHLYGAIQMIDSNPLEWGVTLAWKKRIAEDVLAENTLAGNDVRAGTPLEKCWRFFRAAVNLLLSGPKALSSAFKSSKDN